MATYFHFIEIIVCLNSYWTPLHKRLHEEHSICHVKLVQQGAERGLLCELY